MKAPFPYFGGKATVAHLVWQALGQPKAYYEPFFGSGAVLLARPNHDPSTHVETVNDSNGFLCNVWRSLQSNPDEVAKWCDYPVNHADLSARKLNLISNKEYLLQNLIKDDMWCDPKLAGYWIWAAGCWIGSGLTSIGQIPHLANAGVGVQEPYNTNIYAWFRQLSERLRYVRVVCGDWTRICGGNWQDKIGDAGIFFDPPYGVTDRDMRCYDEHDSADVAHDVREWCIERGKLPRYRIVLAGYEEHKELLDHGWTVKLWETGGGYENTKQTNKGSANRKRECLYLSPNCYQSELLF